MKRLCIVAILLVIMSGCAVTPTPFTPDEIDEQVQSRLSELTTNQDPVMRDITLYDAMARALKYNLDYKVAVMEEALRSSELGLTSWDMLPKLVANAGFNGRGNYSGASSSELLGRREVGEESLVASTSSERDTFSTDLQLSWDVLDFGLSYVRAKQQADRVMIANERRRKIATRIIEDVRTAFWRAVSAQRLITQLKDLEEEVNDTLSSAEEAYEHRKVSPLPALTYQRELLNIKEEIQKLESELVVSKRQLATLMNLTPGQRFYLAIPKRDDGMQLTVDIEEMVDTALHCRAELREAAYEERINKQEAKAELLRMLPSLRFFGGVNYDSNDYLYNNLWPAWGAQVSWNMIQACSYDDRKKAVDARSELLREQSLAITMAVITEVHISRLRHEHSRRKFATARKTYNVQKKILEQIGAGHRTNAISRQTYIRERMNFLLREIKFDLAYANMQNSTANIYASMGLDPYGRDIDGDEPVDEIARKLEHHWTSLNADMSGLAGEDTR